MLHYKNHYIKQTINLIPNKICQTQEIIKR